MCGIAGFIDRGLDKADARRLLNEMLGRIIHRGPDAAGTHHAPATGLTVGMRRLSIIDLEGGGQPIWNEDHTIGVVFNGEIYNYVDLRQELQAAGHQFSTHSDTEVLVHLYEEHGEEMVERLRGMFAFAIFDQRIGELLIARDHFGQKPLYYTQAGDRFAFGSELKCLFALPWVSRDRDPAALLDYCAWLSLPPPRTHYKNILKLAAGSLITIPLAHPSEAKVRKYWSYSPGKRPFNATVEELDTALRDSLKVHLRADVPLGVLLSSGLDSRTVSAYAQDLMGGTMQTFTVGFGGDDSEAAEAARTAREIHSNHHTVEVTPSDLGHGIEKVAWHLDEPVGDPAAFAVLKICQYARRHVKVLLSGEGADELFGGYDGRYLGMLQTLNRSDRLRPLGMLLLAPNPAAPRTRWNRLRERVNQSRAAEAVALRIEGLPGDIRTPRGFTTEQLGRLRERTREIAAQMYRPQNNTLNELLALDLDWQLAESLLQKADKMSMGASIELRTPLLDVKIAELAARVPRRLKLPPGGPGKLILRQCLARKLDEPLDRPKKGFPIPLRDWFSGPLRAQVEASLFARDAASAEQIDPRLLHTAWEDFLCGEWQGARFFYALWLYEIWAKRDVN